tara:strand:- start:185 stop:514 length:330 start_codon:yes stop_codon:yes gene_type:complete
MTESTSNLIGAGFTAILGTLSSIKEAKNQRELQEKIIRMSLAQKRELEIRMQDAQTAVARQKILFEALAVDKHHALIRETSREKSVSLVVVGIGAILLAVIIYQARRKK